LPPAPPLPLLALITTDALTLDALAQVVARACAAAASGDGRLGVQLRAKNVGGAQLLVAARRLRDVTYAAGVSFVVNDRVDVALIAGADGVHLPAAGMASLEARRLLGTDKLLGRSVHSFEEIDRERVAGTVDYLHFGPVFATASKAQYGRPQGVDGLARAVERAGGLPIVAVGGITPRNAATVLQVGASGVAAIGAVMNATDPREAVRELLRSAQGGKEPR
jgi:thiamine-phosphate pyrophosphorylase